MVLRDVELPGGLVGSIMPLGDTSSNPRASGVYTGKGEKTKTETWTGANFTATETWRDRVRWLSSASQ